MLAGHQQGNIWTKTFWDECLLPARTRSTCCMVCMFVYQLKKPVMSRLWTETTKMRARCRSNSAQAMKRNTYLACKIGSLIQSILRVCQRGNFCVSECAFGAKFTDAHDVHAYLTRKSVEHLPDHIFKKYCGHCIQFDHHPVLLTCIPPRDYKYVYLGVSARLPGAVAQGHPNVNAK